MTQSSPLITTEKQIHGLLLRTEPLWNGVPESVLLTGKPGRSLKSNIWKLPFHTLRGSSTLRSGDWKWRDCLGVGIKESIVHILSLFLHDLMLPQLEIRKGFLHLFVQHVVHGPERWSVMWYQHEIHAYVMAHGVTSPYSICGPCTWGMGCGVASLLTMWSTDQPHQHHPGAH